MLHWELKKDKGIAEGVPAQRSHVVEGSLQTLPCPWHKMSNAGGSRPVYALQVSKERNIGTHTSIWITVPNSRGSTDSTCDETQAVSLEEPLLSSSTGIPTVSINRLSSNLRSIYKDEENCHEPLE